MNNAVKIFIWLLVVMATTTWGFDLLSLPSTIANICGACLIFAIAYISIKTQCFTTINLNKNNKNNEK